MMNEFLLYAGYYQAFGMNITHLKGNDDIKSFKVPTDENWADFIDNNQDVEEALQYNWDDATGIGLITGHNNYRAIDIDSLYCQNEYYALSTEEGFYNLQDEFSYKFIQKCLEILGLPEDYPWIVRSGSGVGYHIIFCCEDIESLNIDNRSFSPNDNWVNSDYNNMLYPIFDRIELSWRFHLVLPPSNYYTEENEEPRKYEFLNKKIPTTFPEYVDVENVNELFNFFCGKSQIISCNYKKQSFKLIRNHKRKCKFSSWTGAYDEHNIEDSVEWLLACNNSDAYNSLGFMFAMGENCQADLSRAKEYFEKSSNAMAKFNLASLIACGAIKGKIEDIELLLSEFFLDKANEELPNISPEDFQNIKIMADKNCREPYYLFFDTETTGKPKDYKAPSSNTDVWPRLVQISWILTDITGFVLNKGDVIIKPQGFEIPKDAIKIHGITNEVASTQGKDIKDVLKEFSDVLKKSKIVVGHNIEFDINVLACEYYRLNDKPLALLMQNKRYICTMKSTVDFCKVRGLWGYKFPKLQELHIKLFEQAFEDAHNALTDIITTKKCFFKLKELGIL